MATLGTKVRKIRELKNLTQDYMASQLNMSQSMYSKYEADDSEMSTDLLDQIANILGVKKEMIESFDEKVVFNNNAEYNSGQNYCSTINNYVIDSEIEKLYKKNIELLEEKIKALEKELGR